MQDSMNFDDIKGLKKSGIPISSPHETIPEETNEDLTNKFDNSADSALLKQSQRHYMDTGD